MAAVTFHEATLSLVSITACRPLQDYSEHLVLFIVVQNLFVAPKYTTPHLTPLTQLTTSASSLTNISPFLTKFYSSPKPAIIIFVNFAVSVLTSIPQLPVPLPPSSFNPSSITVILFKSYYNLSESQLTRLQYSFYRARNARIASAVLATAIPSVCPSVCHTPVLCQNDGT